MPTTPFLIDTVVPVNLAQGLDTKTDFKYVVPGKVLTLQNGQYQKPFSVQKRNGYTGLSAEVLTGGLIATGTNTATYTGELLYFENGTVYSYSQASGQWVNKGPCVSVKLSYQDVVRNNYQQANPDVAVANGIGVYAWEDSRGGVRATVMDEETGTPIVNDVLLNATGSRPKCVSIGGTLYVTYVATGTLAGRKINSAAPSTIGSEVAIDSTVNPVTSNYDVCNWAGNIGMAHNVQGSNSTLVAILSPTTLGLKSSTTITESCNSAVSVHVTPLNNLAVVYASSTGSIRGVVVNPNMTVLSGSVQLDPTTANIVSICGVALPGSASQVWYQVSASNGNYYDYIQTQTFLDNPAMTGSISGSNFIRGCGLASKPFILSGTAYLGVSVDTPLQATNFVMRQDALAVAKINPGNCGGLRSNRTVANFAQDSAGTFKMCQSVRGALQAQTGSIFSLSGVARSTVDFTSLDRYRWAQLGTGILICGGVINYYDGVSAPELGFHFYPELLTSTFAAGSSGSVDPGQRQYVAVYEWMDNGGQIHQSAPTPLAVTVNNNQLGAYTITVPTLRVTQKQGTRTPPVVALYRTTANGTTFYKVSSLTNPTYNSASADTVTFIDLLADSGSLSNQLLYTNGGAQAYNAPPAASNISIYKNRAILAGLEQPATVWYSGQHDIGLPVWFSLGQQQDFNELLPFGGVHGLGVLNDILIVFGSERIFMMYGTGPDASGIIEGNFTGFSVPQLVSTDAGCIAARSIVQIPEGLMFLSNKGIYRMNAGLSVDYVGAPVEAFNGTPVTAASLVSNNNEVRFLTNQNVCLVYNYYVNEWSTFTIQGTDATIWDGTYVYVANDGTIRQETPGFFYDINAPIPLVMETSWLSFAGVQGYQRVKWAYFLGDFRSQHTWKLSVGYNFSPAYQTVYTMDPMEAFDELFFGGDPVFGGNIAFGTGLSVYQYRAKMVQQKCQAVRFRIEDVNQQGTGESFAINAMTLIVGRKDGGVKLPKGPTT